jgi:hypothetical protein
VVERERGFKYQSQVFITTKAAGKNVTIHLPANHTMTKFVAENMGTVKTLA